MTLILRALDPPHDEHILDERAAFTMGRGGDNDWVLADPSREISKTHCRIEPQDGALILIDLSVNGIVVEGADRPMGPGGRHRLSSGDVFNIGRYRFKVLDATDEDAVDMGHDSDQIVPISISQILAGEREGTEVRASASIAGEAAGWLGNLPTGAATEGLMKPLGWSEPPQSQPEPLPPAFDDQPVEFANRSEHTPAPNSALRLPRAQQLLPTDWMDEPRETKMSAPPQLPRDRRTISASDEPMVQLAEGAGLLPATLAEADEDLIRRAGEVIRVLLDGLDAIEAAQAAADQECRLPQSANEDLVIDSLAVLLIDPTSATQQRLQRRMAVLATRQQAFGKAVAQAAADWETQFAPDTLAPGGGVGPFAKAAAWRRYSKRYRALAGSDATTSAANGMLALIRQAFAGNMAKR